MRYQTVKMAVSRSRVFRAKHDPSTSSCRRPVLFEPGIDTDRSERFGGLGHDRLPASGFAGICGGCKNLDSYVVSHGLLGGSIPSESAGQEKPLQKCVVEGKARGASGRAHSTSLGNECSPVLDGRVLLDRSSDRNGPTGWEEVARPA
jgi:hypothetical protein